MTAAASVVADVADPAAVDRVFDVVRERFGHLDGLASNAGTIGSIGPLTSTSLEDYQALMRANAQSAFLFLRGYAQAAIAAGQGGSVVLTSSAAGLKGSPGLVAYSMSKQALVGLTRSAAVELGEHGIRVNAVCPGRIDTPLLDAFGSLAGRASGLEGRPIARMADPREVAYLIAWLLSDEASFATGGIYPIDGGHTA
jgi:NAD(P)-dependent dehydrogenase (short-subunit alcohol dehydrogenase family)